MFGCPGHLFKAFLGLIFICIMLWAGYKLITEPYHPPKENTSVETPAPQQDYSEYKSKPSAEDDKYEVKKLMTETKCDNHDYIMENTIQKSWVEMKLTPELERGLVFVIKVFKAVFSQDFTPTVISAHDSFDKHDKWSRHRTGRAVDIRLDDLPLKPKRKVMRILQGTLPPEYKAIWENQYLSNEHLHFQSDH